MLAVLSDLHFQDTMNDILRDDDGRTLVDVDRNVSSKAFRFIFDELIGIANKVKAKELSIVLAGDIFDLNRSQAWFKGPVRPYGKHAEDEWLPRAKEILNDIRESNGDTFGLFGEYAGRRLENGASIAFSYLPGNHDRLVNLHDDLRRQVRGMLGMNAGNAAPFPHEIVLPGYGVHVRHGHEYDRTNFAGDVPASGTLHCDPKDYASAPLGDFVTIDIVARIAYEYRRRYEEKMKAGDLAHCLLYRKLLEFDDLRPLSDLIPFMKAETADGDSVLKRHFMPVVSDVIGDALKSDFFGMWLGKWKILTARLIKFLSTEALLERITRMDSEPQRPWEFALREHDLAGDDAAYRYVVAGHTHNPDVVFLRRNAQGRERFFIDTGTWRQQIRKCQDGTSFARAKALTYALFYGPETDTVEAQGAGRFDYWSGYTKTVEDQGR